MPVLKEGFGSRGKLLNSARVAVREVVDAREGERVLIIANPVHDVLKIAQALYDAATEAGATSTLIVQPTKASFDYMNVEVAEAIATAPEIVCSISHRRMGKDRGRLKNPLTASDGKSYDHIFDYLLRGEKKIRGFWAPQINTEIFTRAVPVDYNDLRNRCARLKEALMDVSNIRVTTKAGTDLTVEVKGRRIQVDDGDFRKPGRGGNLPAGEIFVSPVVGSTCGTFIVDGSITIEDAVLVKTPIKVTVENGYVKMIEGSEEAERLKKFIEEAEKKPYTLVKNGTFDERKAAEYSRNARHIGELGIGMNPKAKIGGNVLEDEKVLGTAHFAIGDNYEEDAPALIHSDGIVKKPTIYADGKVIMKDGRLLV
jgi:leucyl aminopeptidase (aminopeptidase T)